MQRKIGAFDKKCRNENGIRKQMHNMARGKKMRKKRKLCILLLSMVLCGCEAWELQRPVDAVQPVLGTEAHQRVTQTTCAEILDKIWAEYGPQERFAVYGGVATEPVVGAAGALEMDRMQVWAAQYHIREPEAVCQGAALSHLLSERLFTCTVFRLRDAKKLQSLAAIWRQGLQEDVWISGPPERLLLVKLRPGYLLQAYGAKEQMERLQQKLHCVYPKAEVVYSEPFMSRKTQISLPPRKMRLPV